jgi:aldehyde dehydrogenase
MAAWKLAPALAAGNCVVLKPAEQTPVTILLFAELIADLLPPGVLNIVNGFGPEAGKPLATSPRVGKVAFTGETTTGRLIMQYASEHIKPVTLELGGKSPNIFTESVMRKDDTFFDKALEGFTMFALNQGEVCTCPSRVLIQESIYDEFMERALERVRKIKMGDPLDPNTMMGAQASNDQYEKILSYLELGKEEGAKCLTGGKPFENELYPDGFYIEPTVFEGHNKMRIFQEEIFGPVVSVTKFKDETELLEIANDTLYGLGAGLWTRDMHQAYQIARHIEAGRVWVNCYHLYPAHAAFGGYKQSGIGRETHKMMLEHYRQTKNLLGQKHGDLMFHQSGGCCDGSSPMCFNQGEFHVGSSDILLGNIAGCPFYMSRSQFEYWKHTQLTVDVTEGRGASFSLEIPLGVRFIIRSRLYTEEERAQLEALG